MSSPHVHFRREGALAWIVQDRPAALNAWDLETVTQFGEALDRCDDETVRVVIVTGAGRAFSGGGDIRAFAASLDDDPGGFVRSLAGTMRQRMITPIRRLPKPVIACINGIAAGGGLSLALACDLRIAAEEARLTFAYSSVGLAADGGSTYFLPRLVGPGLAAELLFSSELLDAPRALALGLVNRVVPGDQLMAATREWAIELAERPAGSLAAIKALLGRTWDADLAGQLAAEVEGMAAQAASPDFREGVSAFLEKRRPRFQASER